MPKNSVEYVKQKVPAFLQRFKEKTGYQEHLLEDKQRDVEQDEVNTLIEPPMMGILSLIL